MENYSIGLAIILVIRFTIRGLLYAGENEGGQIL